MSTFSEYYMDPPDTPPNINRFGLDKKFPHLLRKIGNKQKKTCILRNKEVAQERLKQLKQSEE